MKRNLALFLLIFFLMSSPTVFGFTFTVTPTPESCSGNGSLSFTTSNADANGTIIFIVYKFPDLTTPYATVSGSQLNGLASGDYRVIARETVGSVITNQQQDVTITNIVVPLEYTVQSLNQACSTTSNIIVTVTSGTAVTYEIFSGPVTFPPQASNTFIGLPVGVYKIRVFDNCGIGVVTTYTVTLNPTGLSVAAPVFSNVTPPSCNFTIATNTITPATGTVIGYPLTIHYVVHPPGGAASIPINSVVNSGNPLTQDISLTIPDYINQSFDYDMTIVDACGTSFFNNFLVNHNITLSAEITNLNCNQNFFTLATSNYTPPYTINFTTSPAGFNPSSFDSSYPGPYNQDSIVFGSDTNPTPQGNYEVTIVDTCGRTATALFEITFVPILPSYTAGNNGCLANSGNIFIAINGADIVTASIISAPSSYTVPLPSSVNSSIDANGNLFLTPLPIGDYTILLTDSCGDVIAPIDITVPAYVDAGLTVNQRPGCELQKGSIRLKSNNAKLTSVIITAAPSSYPNALPFNVSNNIINIGDLFLSGLPAGSYTFQATDECGFTNTIALVIDGYAITNSTFSLHQNCGSFDIPLNFVSNGTANQAFWLQKLIDPDTDQWGHPGTNVPYTDGTVPNATNSLSISNLTTNYNLTYNGTFRIVRNFLSYINGADYNSGAVNSGSKDCIEILSPTLMFNQALEIVDASRIPCSTSGNLDVVIEANGALPLHYTITEKDGLPFFVDNGNSNIFYNLLPSIYVFEVQDNCGNVVNRIFDVSTLLSLVNATQPGNLLDCQETITGNETFDLTQQNAVILGSQPSTDYTLSYYTSLANATAGVNPIGNLTNFNPTTNPQTIYARLIFNPLPNCYETTSFDLIVGQVPKLDLDATYFSCLTTPIDIDASVNNLPITTYSWSNGVTGPVVSVGQPGTTNLTVTATNSYGAGLECTNTKDIAVTVSQLPVVDHIETHDWTETENSITVITSNSGDFLYSIDGVFFQTDNHFTNLPPGLYTVYIRDNVGCGTIEQVVWLLDYPRYFTPNGDGFHETWRIQNSELEPDFKVVIYDRYGKLINSFRASSEGWDGTYNGQLMFATDYWFVVYRQDGRIHKGHFSLKR